MADAKKCDRCHVYYDPNHEKYIDEMSKAHYEAVDRTREKVTGQILTTEKDMCRDCIDELGRFWMQGVDAVDGRATDGQFNCVYTQK